MAPDSNADKGKSARIATRIGAIDDENDDITRAAIGKLTLSVNEEPGNLDD
jgi:hypothetical protein